MKKQNKLEKKLKLSRKSWIPYFGMYFTFNETQEKPDLFPTNSYTINHLYHAVINSALISVYINYCL